MDVEGPAVIGGSSGGLMGAERFGVPGADAGALLEGTFAVGGGTKLTFFFV